MWERAVPFRCVFRWAQEGLWPQFSLVCLLGRELGLYGSFLQSRRAKRWLGVRRLWAPTYDPESLPVATFPNFREGTCEPLEKTADRCRRQPFFYNISNNSESYSPLESSCLIQYLKQFKRAGVLIDKVLPVPRLLGGLTVASRFLPPISTTKQKLAFPKSMTIGKLV